MTDILIYGIVGDEWDGLDAKTLFGLIAGGDDDLAVRINSPGGYVMVKVGLAMAAGNLLGGYVGARTAVRLGSGFVRVVFIVVVSAFIVRISWQLLGIWP